MRGEETQESWPQQLVDRDQYDSEHCQHDPLSQMKTAGEPLGNPAALKCDIIASPCSLHLEEIQQGKIETSISP